MTEFTVPSFSTIVYMMTFYLVLLDWNRVFKVVVTWFSSDRMLFLLLKHTLLNRRILTVGSSALFLVQKSDLLWTLPQKILGELVSRLRFLCTFQVQSTLGRDKLKYHCVLHYLNWHSDSNSFLATVGPIRLWSKAFEMETLSQRWDLQVSPTKLVYVVLRIYTLINEGI